ncbi:hypothetical protein HDU67_004531 [Dinochytrium kinnereticum]|nr:hypothetical protein HDU67_004531 [Dinochytrium kinnereticum]
MSEKATLNSFACLDPHALGPSQPQIKRKPSKKRRNRRKASTATLRHDFDATDNASSVYSHETGESNAESLDSTSLLYHHTPLTSGGERPFMRRPPSIQSMNTTQSYYSSDDALLSADTSSESGHDEAYDSFEDDLNPSAVKRIPNFPKANTTSLRRRATSQPSYTREDSLDRVKRRQLSPSPSSITRVNLGSTAPTHKAAPRFGRTSVVYTIWRYPLLIFIVAAILLDLTILFTVKFLVFLWEYLFTWRGVRQKLRTFTKWASNYDEWKEAAKNLDTYLGHDSWKSETDSDLYNFKLIQKTTRRLRRFRLSNDATEVRRLLTHACKRNHGGCSNESLYSHSHYGTKDILERYWNEVVKSLDFVANSPTLSLVGVMKALFEQGILPEVVTGTSAGSLMAALVCTRTDEEIVEDGIFESDVIRYTSVMSDPWITRIKRWYNTGALFDSEDGFHQMGIATKGHMTFMEAYRKTGRILCITVVPDEIGTMSPPKVLNFLTAPDVLISSAIVASSAVPGVLLPSRLLCKTPTGEFISWHGSGKRWRDGSIRTDIPDLPWLNIGFKVVSQVNPHISIFFYESQGSAGCPTAHRSGRGWRGGFLASTIVHHLDLDLKKWLRLTKDLRLLPPIASTDVSSLWLQQFEGTATILPAGDHRILDWFQILNDPRPDRMQLCLDRGRARTWPKVHFIWNRMRVENAIKRHRLALVAEEIGEGSPAASLILGSSPQSSPIVGSRQLMSVADEEDSDHDMVAIATEIRKRKAMSLPVPPPKNST